MTKTFKISAPVGNFVPPKDVMTEQEIRDFFPQIVQDPATAAVWAEKAAQDPIEELVELLQRSGYEITEQK